MSSRRCFKDGCASKIYGKCECEGIILFCKKHYSSHAKKETSKVHQCIRLYFKPEEEIKRPIIDKLKEFKKDIEICRDDAIVNANEIIKNFTTAFRKYINQIKDIEVRCNKMIENLLSGEKILDVAADDDIESLLKLSASDIQNIGWNIKGCYLKYNEVNEAIKNIFNCPFNPIRQNQENSNCLDELSFFRFDSKKFVTINLNTFKISSTVTLPTREPIDAGTRSCILPDKTYFYCGNHSSPGSVFTIDKNKNVKQLQKSKINYSVDPIYYNNFIYLIGGQNNLAERYDLKENIWESLAPMTQSLNLRCSCSVLYRDLILFTSYSIRKILIYSIFENNYQEVQNLDLKADYYKLMLVGNNRIYAFEKGGRTFESDECNISSWSYIGTNDIIDNTNQSSVVRYKGCLYFVNCSDALYKFDLSSKQDSLVAAF